MEYRDEDLARILREARVIAVIGASRSLGKDAGRVPAFLKEKGYRIIPINPVASEILGERAYPSLLDLPEELAGSVDIVDVFRPPREAEAVVEQVLELARRTGRRPVLWFQPGTHTPEAVERAQGAGLRVVYGRCIMAEYSRLEAMGLL
ncbi:MAG: CoA-binding protein [Desulfurococcales archaeon]|nr:CoA-binding protein [Desulfurococcales archaeon]